MSIVNVVLNDQTVVIYADSLMMCQGRVVSFTDKVHPVGHSGVLIAGRGVKNVIEAWARVAQASSGQADVHALAAAAPAFLRDAWSYGAYAEEEADGTNSTTVFQYGWCTAEERFIGFAHRSGDDFEPVRIVQGLMIAPGLEDSTGVEVTSLDDLDAVSVRQHDEDRAADRFPSIGGELIAYQLERVDGFSCLKTYRRLRFSSFDADAAAMAFEGQVDRDRWSYSCLLASRVD